MLLNEQPQIFLNIFLMNCKTNILTVFIYFALLLKKTIAKAKWTIVF